MRHIRHLKPITKKILCYILIAVGIALSCASIAVPILLAPGIAALSAAAALAALKTSHKGKESHHSPGETTTVQQVFFDNHPTVLLGYEDLHHPVMVSEGDVVKSSDALRLHEGVLFEHGTHPCELDCGKS
jgi:hypothetical protein